MNIGHAALAFILLIPIPGCSSDSASGGPTPPAGTVAVSVVQGSDRQSPMVGKTVTVSAVVTGDFQDFDDDSLHNLGGFYIQQELPDGDARTSDGVFVFDGDSEKTDVEPGDRVFVTGEVAEFFGETQIQATHVRVTGRGTIEPLSIKLPAARTMRNSNGDEIADLERYEGMLLRLPDALTVSDLRTLQRFGDMRLVAGERPYQFTQRNRPDVRLYRSHKSALAARSIILDDSQRSANPETIRHLHAGIRPGYSIRLGDSATNVVGTLRYSRGSGGNGDEGWRLMPVTAVKFSATNPRPGKADVDGRLKVASFNVLNFFSGIDTGRPTCGPRGNHDCRGADSRDELSRQLEKTATAIATMGADIVGLVELENNDSESIAMIADALNSKAGNAQYEFVDTGAVGEDTIKTGFLYDSTTVRTEGKHALLTSAVDDRFNDSRNRPAVAQTFRELSTGAQITIVVNHLKSKGSSCEEDGDPNRRDGQGNCNRTRTNAVDAMLDWIAENPTGGGDSDVLVIGDLNAYSMEDPLLAFKAAGYVNLLDRDEDSYSFSFDGQAGALDHALVSASLARQVVAILEWHINADEPGLLDYNLDNGRDPGLFDAESPYRSSDHDPIIIGLDLDP